MEVHIHCFGQTKDITGCETLVLENIPDTDTAQIMLYEKYPALRDIRFVLAVNRQVISSNTILEHQATIALLPPFSGG